MSNKIVALSPTHHQALRVDNSRGYPHAGHLDTTLLLLDEVQKAVADYCILFNKDIQTGEFKLIALLGLGFGINAFQNTIGWNATYIPRNISRYPFLLAWEDGRDRPLLGIDENAPQLNLNRGHALFNEDGTTSAFQKQMFEQLNHMNIAQTATQNFTTGLAEHGLLQALTLDAKMQDGRTHSIEGLYSINATALEDLGEQALKSLHAQSYLEPLFLIKASTAQLPRLVQLHNAQQDASKIKTLEIHPVEQE